ncbi:hypothetical protein FACS1894208_00940 [Clostridia bacterium]|nr:hypothetical protein FACS1894208_00940 [Clostridia bacterium]
MKIRVLCVTLALLVVIAGCTSGQADPVSNSSSQSDLYDWDSARNAIARDVVKLLKTVVAGTPEEYRNANTTWADKLSPAVHASLFPAGAPSQRYSASVRYSGYSAPEFNSDGAEYLLFNVRRMENSSLLSSDWQVTIKLSRTSTSAGDSRTEYYISGYSAGANRTTGL